MSVSSAGVFDDAKRTARDLLADEDKAQGHTRTGLGSLPRENGLAMKQSKKQSNAGRLPPSTRPELSGKSAKSLASSHKAKESTESSSSASFSEALRSAKRKSTTQEGGDKKRWQSTGTSLRSEVASAPLGGEAFCEDHMLLDDAFGDDNSLQRYIKTSALKAAAGGSSLANPSLGRGLVQDGESKAMVDLSPLPSSSILTGSSRIANEIHQKRQEDAKVDVLL